MKCSPKTMLKIGLVLAVIIGGGFLTFPQFRPAIIGLAPFALFALCPISMFFAARGMNKDKVMANSEAVEKKQEETDNKESGAKKKSGCC